MATLKQNARPADARKTILIVDDDPVILDLVSGYLTKKNQYTIITATSGEEAVRLSKNHVGQIHLLLTDFQMPKMSGVVLATEMSQQRPDLKVLLMSGFTDGMLVLNEGWHFLAKPFVPSQLNNLIVSLISPELAQHPRSVAGGK